MREKNLNNKLSKISLLAVNQKSNNEKINKKAYRLRRNNTKNSGMSTWGIKVENTEMVGDFLHVRVVEERLNVTI